MKKIVSTGILFVLATVPAFADVAVQPKQITKTDPDTYTITYDYRDKAKTGWYLTGRAEISFLNFKNKYSVAEFSDTAEDSYSFESVFGGSLSLGHQFNYFWRAELEAGYLGYFSDEDASDKFSISLPYLMVAGYRDFTNGLYVGAGVGAALSQYELKSDFGTKYDTNKTTVSPMAGIMLGYTHKLDDNLVLDLRYRLAGLTGAELKTNIELQDPQTGEVVAKTSLKSKTDFILDNSISLGIRYEF